MEDERRLDYTRNSLFVRNLSPNVTESVLREVFERCDEIEKVTFKPYPGNEKQFFARIDFKTSAGVAEGSKLSGSAILGVVCTCGVIDPIQQAESGRQLALQSQSLETTTQEEQADQEFEIRADHLRKAKEAAEHNRLRTCHIAGLGADFKVEKLKRLCEGFGQVEMLRIDKDSAGLPFGLVEFADEKVAHVVKMTRQFLVEDRVLVFTEAKSHVDNARIEEMTVEFQAPIIDAMNMRTVLSQQTELADKLAKVKAAATELMSGLKGADQEEGEPKAGKKKDKKKEKKHKKNKDQDETNEHAGEEGRKQKKHKDKTKKDKKQKDKKQGKDKNDKQHTKEKKHKRKDRPASEAGHTKQLVSSRSAVTGDTEEAGEAKTENDEEFAYYEEGEEEAVLDIDEEVEVMPESEVIGMLQSSSSTSSSTDYGEDALVEMPVDVAEGMDDDVISDGDDVMCESPPPTRPPLHFRGRGFRGRGRGAFRGGRAPLPGRGLMLPLPGRGLMPPRANGGILLQRRVLAPRPMPSPPGGSIDLDCGDVHDVKDISIVGRRRRPQGEVVVG
eukprot:TRINITY_DN108016_c0_g1_i1.p1 TRINITY_DN108016_c0_g1~~TRINITY_DN108016_c0_g1_i1.p1  ORF type:complete len:558 (-),score=146.60 TRINITY_DN108016_c0_g1_i1:105-1778(-)